MKNVKALTSISYRDDLIDRLQDPNYAAGYLETHLEEPAPDPAFIRIALTDVLDALSQQRMTSEQSEQHRQKLNELLLQPGELSIYELAQWLQALGLKLTVVPDQSS